MGIGLSSHSQTLAQIPNRLNPTPETPLQIPEPIKPPQLETPSPQNPLSTPEDIPGTIKLKGFEFLGNTAFSDEQLNEVLKEDFIGKEITFADFIKIEEKLSKYYIDKGYINSGAVIEAGQSFSPESAVVMGFGDSIDLTYNNSDGSNAVDFNYVVPVSPHNTTIRLASGYSGNEVIDRNFQDIDITGKYFYYQLSLRQPLLQSPTQEFAVGLTLSRQESKNFL
jgi:hemolysin activation/secretion protein